MEEARTDTFRAHLHVFSCFSVCKEAFALNGQAFL